jgi:hypothetical protein
MAVRVAISADSRLQILNIFFPTIRLKLYDLWRHIFFSRQLHSSSSHLHSVGLLAACFFTTRSALIKSFGVFAIALALSACATESPTETSQVRQPCYELTKTTGSHMLKREACVESSDSERDEAQRAAREMIDDQMRNTMPRIKP